MEKPRQTDRLVEALSANGYNNFMIKVKLIQPREEIHTKAMNFKAIVIDN